jgi:RNA polymerase sigma factor (sigma-70 family)
VSRHLPFARKLARQFAGRGIELEDLRQEAALALVQAANEFDPFQTLCFSTFMHWVVVRHLRDLVSRASAETEWARDDAEVDEFVTPPGADRLPGEELVAAMKQALDSCSTGEREAILEFYGFPGVGSDRSREATRQRACLARKKIKQALLDSGWTEDDVRTVLAS